MSLRWFLLILAAVALTLPLPAFYSRKRRYRTLHHLDIERRNGSRWQMWSLVLRFSGHWVELVRGLVAGWGTWFLIDDLKILSPLYTTHAAWARAVLPLTLALICVVLTAFLFRYPGKALAPFAFVGAVLLVLVPIAVSGPAVFFAVCCAVPLRSLRVFFLIAAPMVALLGVLLDRQIWPSIAGAILAAAPVLIAFFREQELLIPVRRPPGGS
jgi:hypothetical protein